MTRRRGIWPTSPVPASTRGAEGVNKVHRRVGRANKTPQPHVRSFSGQNIYQALSLRSSPPSDPRSPNSDTRIIIFCFSITHILTSQTRWCWLRCACRANPRPFKKKIGYRNNLRFLNQKTSTSPPHSCPHYCFDDILSNHPAIHDLLLVLLDRYTLNMSWVPVAAALAAALAAVFVGYKFLAGGGR